MAARAAKRREDPTAAERGDEDAVDPVEATDVDTVEDDELAEAGLSELDVDEDGFDDEDSDEDSDEDEGSTDVPHGEGADLADGDEEVTVATVPPDAAFDDEEDARVVAAVVGDDDDDDDGIEGLRDGEFVCRSCYMAKRESQLADADRMFCRDCA